MTASSSEWYKQFITVLGVNAWAPEWYADSITDFDADKIADVVSACGALVGATFQGFSQDHFGVSFFPTALGHKHVNLKEGRDHIREYSEALHRRGKKFFAYYCYQDRYLWDRNPDWRQKDASGSDIGSLNFGDLCPNSPYRDHVIMRVGEINRNYDVDGWLLDMLEFARGSVGCYCPYCRRKYREAFGTGLPSGDPQYDGDWLRFVRWRYKCIEELLRDVVREVKTVRPECVFTHNAFAFRRGNDWECGEDFEQLFEYDDVVTNIPAWNYGRDTHSRFVDTIWKAGLYTRVFRGLSRKPVWMQFGRFPYDRDFQCQPAQELSLAAYSVIVNGGCPFLIDNVYPDGTVDKVATKRLSGVFEDIRAKEALFDYDDELAYAGVFHSRSSNVWSDLAHPGESRYLLAFEGTCKALSESHVPYQVVGEHGLTGDQLARFKVVVLPEAAVMDEEVLELFRQYAAAGGGLVAMGRVGLSDSSGRARDNFALADVLGVDYVGPLNYTLSYLKRTGEHPVFAGWDPDLEHVAVKDSRSLRFQAREGTEILALSVPPASEVVPGARVFTYSFIDAPPHKHASEPGLAATTYGSGKCIYVGSEIGRSYGVYGSPELRQLLVEAVKWCGGESPVEVSAPLCVESAAYTTGNRLVLHLLNYGPMRLRLCHDLGGAMAEESIPVGNIDIRVSLGGRKVRRAYYAGPNEDLSFTTDGGTMSVSGVRVETHCLVVIEYAA
jgi:hypothetical protein